jgi:voltage-gated potassium channel Kch
MKNTDDISSRIKLSFAEAVRIRHQFRLVGAATLVTLATGVVMMHYLEDLSFIDALYFSVVSLTTVGYGDFTPQTTGGKLFVIFYLIIGIAIVGSLINLIIRSAVARQVVNKTGDESES